MVRTRLCLVTPTAPLPDFPAALDAALAGDDVGSLIIPPLDGAGQGAFADRLRPIAHRHGVAAIVAGDSDIASRLDGVHVETGLADLRAALARHRPDRIVGAGGVRSRHDAMSFGEAGADYLFFGRLDGDTAPGIHEKSFDLAAWWAELFEIPAIVMGGLDLASVAEAAGAGIEFVALRRAVWEHPAGPAAAVADANRLLLAGVGATA